jgi:hypothetical protein
MGITPCFRFPTEGKLSVLVFGRPWVTRNLDKLMKGFFSLEVIEGNWRAL